MAAYLTNAADQKIELSEGLSNRIGSGPNVEVKLDGIQGLHAMVKCYGPGWWVMNLTYDGTSVRHRGRMVKDYTEIGDGDAITVGKHRLIFHKC